MLNKTYIIINTQFAATHHWPECTIATQQHLKLVHRHVFHVRMKWEVGHNDRELEFIEMKEFVESFIDISYRNRFIGKKSCEMLCEELAQQFKAQYVRVMEDNENGAEWLSE